MSAGRTIVVEETLADEKFFVKSRYLVVQNLIGQKASSLDR